MALHWQQQDLRVQLREMLMQTHSHWQQANDVSALYQKELLPLSRENLTTARDEYQSGSGDFLSLLTAQRQLLSTERMAQQAMRDQFAQFSQLLAAAGVVFEHELPQSPKRNKMNSPERTSVETIEETNEGNQHD